LRRFFKEKKRTLLKRSHQVLLLISLVLVLDQALKFYIKTTFCYNQDVPILGLDWARLHFVENEGMAFGITFGWEYGKLLLSLFRILMVAALIWYLRMLLSVQAPRGFLFSVGLITAGAIGNIIDSAFYGLIFTESPYHDCVPARLVPPGQGYGTFLHGKVVDMFYFPIAWLRMPEWLPKIGGQEWLFFSPIFNVADASITVGVVIILLFQRRFFREEHHPAMAPAAPEVAVAPLAEGGDASAPGSSVAAESEEQETQEKSLSDD